MFLARTDLLWKLIDILAKISSAKFEMTEDIDEMFFFKLEVTHEDRRFLLVFCSDRNDQFGNVSVQSAHLWSYVLSYIKNFSLQWWSALDHAYVFTGRVGLPTIVLYRWKVRCAESENTTEAVKLELTELLSKGGPNLTKRAANFDQNEFHNNALAILGRKENIVADTLKNL